MSFQFGGSAGQPSNQPMSNFSFTGQNHPPQNKSFGFGTAPAATGKKIFVINLFGVFKITS